MSNPTEDPFMREFQSVNPCRRQLWAMVIGLLLSTAALAALFLMREQWFNGNDLLFYTAIGSLMIVAIGGGSTIGAYYLCLISYNKGRR
jgi:hypothetical protein